MSPSEGKPVRCVGFPEGKECDGQIAYNTLSLCTTCYQARRRHLAKVDRDTPAEPAPEEAPGVLLTESVTKKRPHHCPLCGQDITLKQSREHPGVQYDKDTHPIRLKRALSVNKSRASIARRFGIDEDTLDAWIEQFPAMTAAVNAVEEEDEILYEAAVVKARGQMSMSGEFQGGDPQLLKMLVQIRHGITDRKPPTDENAAESLRKLEEVADGLLKKFGVMIDNDTQEKGDDDAQNH